MIPAMSSALTRRRGACCWCTRTRTTSRSAPGPRWPGTPPKVPRSRWSPARSASSARSSRRRWPTWPRSGRTGWGQYRIGELAAACAALGVTDHRFLGGPGRWRDSGMMGTAGNADPRCFWRADLDEAARALLDVIAEIRPQVLVTYDANGAYGHPDHIQAHRVAWRACELAGPGRAGQVLRHRRAGLRPAVTTEIDAAAWFGRKLAAMRAHATQITVTEPFFALSDGVPQRASGTEYYTLLAGRRPAAGGPRDRPVRPVTCWYGMPRRNGEGNTLAGHRRCRILCCSCWAVRGPDRQLPVQPRGRAGPGGRDRPAAWCWWPPACSRPGPCARSAVRWSRPSAGSLASFLLSMPLPSGSVIITSTTPGEWYLYGGTLPRCSRWGCRS